MDELGRHIHEALKSLEPGADSQALVEAVRRLQLGLPAEDEFSLLLTWLQRCKLIHKFGQFQSPITSSERYRVPDLLAVFEHNGREVPVLIEVKTRAFKKNLSWRPDYRDSLCRYADLLGLPLLIACRFGPFWTLFDVSLMKKPDKNFKISFFDALRNTLMCELAGDFSYSLKPRVSFHVRVRKHSESSNGFEGRIEETFWTSPEGIKVTSAQGILALFMCIDHAAELVEDDEFATQTFNIPAPSPELGFNGQFAHRALVILQRFASGSDERNIPPPMAGSGMRQLVENASSAGFRSHQGTHRPRDHASFLEQSL